MLETRIEINTYNEKLFDKLIIARAVQVFLNDEPYPDNDC